MTRKLGPKTRLETLKKDAKRWLKALRAGDPEALTRLAAAYPTAPLEPVLRDVQHALAREFGQDSWEALKTALADRALAALSDDDKAAVILKSAWDGDLAAASRLAARNPQLSRHSLALAVMFGDLAEVERRLANDPAEAMQRFGPLNWEPILYLAYGRLPVPAAAQNAVAIAALLLDNSADPAARFDDGWGNPFTLLTGIIGMGEGVRPPHPRVIPLATLFLDRGTDPFDSQVLYDTSIVGDHVGWLEPLFRRSEARGDAHRWTTWIPGAPVIGGNKRMSPVDYLLGNAVSYNHTARAEWLILHGANPNGVNSYSGLRHHHAAQLNGSAAMADLLVKLGAKPVILKGQAAFNAACARGDLQEIERLARRHPGLLKDTTGLHQAVSRNDMRVLERLLDLGMHPDRPNHAGFRPIHNAGHAGAVDAARRLIAAGVDLDTCGSNYHATPLGSAVYWKQQGVIDLIAPRTRDVHGLAFIGRLDRLAEVLEAEPDRVHARRPRDGDTPLFTLPDDEEAAEAVARVLLAHGSDPKATNRAGETAEAAARRRGLDGAADLIAACGRKRA